MSEHENIKDKTQNTKFVNNISQSQNNENLNNKDNEILETSRQSSTNLRTSSKRLQDSQARRYLGENACSLPSPQDGDKFEPHAKTIETPIYGNNDSKHHRQPSVTSHAYQHSKFIPPAHKHDWLKNDELEFERPSVDTDNLSSSRLWALQDHTDELRNNKKTFKSFSLSGLYEPKIQRYKDTEVERSSSEHLLGVVGAVHHHSRNQLLECENKIKRYDDGHTLDVKEFDGRYFVDRRLEVKENVDQTLDGGDGSKIFHGAQAPELEDNFQMEDNFQFSYEKGDSGKGGSKCQSRKVKEISSITHPHSEGMQHENHYARDTGNLCFERQPTEIGHSEKTNSESRQMETRKTSQMLDAKERYEKSSKSRSLTELDYEDKKCQFLEREDNSKISSKSQSLAQGTALKSNDFIRSANIPSLRALHSKQHLNSDHQNERAKLQPDKELVPRAINPAEAVDGFQNDDPHSQGARNHVAIVSPPLASRHVSEETKSCIDRLLPTQERQFPDADAGLSSVNKPSFSTELHLPIREEGHPLLAPSTMVHRHNCEMRGMSPSPRSPDERCVARGLGSLAPVPTGYSPSEITATRRRGRVRLRDSSTLLLTGMHRRDDSESERLLVLRGPRRPAALHHQQRRRPTSDPALGVHCLVAAGVTITPDERDFRIPGVVNLISSAARASRVPEIRGNRDHFSCIHLRPGISVQREETGEDNIIPAQVVEPDHRAPPGVPIYHQDTHDIDLQLQRVLGPHLHLRSGSTIQFEGVTEVSFTDLDVSLSSALGRRLAYRIFAGLDSHPFYEAEGDENNDSNASDTEDEEGAT